MPSWDEFASAGIFDRRGTVQSWSEECGKGVILSDDGIELSASQGAIVGGGIGALEEGERVLFQIAGGGSSDLRAVWIKPEGVPVELEEAVFLLGDDGYFRYLPCVRGPSGNIVIDGSDLASVLTEASLPRFRAPRNHLLLLCGEFERLINHPSVDEAALQNFFESNPEFLLADQFEALYPQVVLPISSRRQRLIPDFILRPIAGMSHEPEIVELKLPQQPVVKLHGADHAGLYAPVHEAVDQLRSYARSFDDGFTRQEVERRLGFTAHRPRLALIVGRASGLPDGRLSAQAMERIAPVEFRTYDDLLLQFRRRVGLD
jgi:cold shock CspA family protein